LPAAASDGSAQARDLSAAAEQIFDVSLVADVYKEDPSLV
jgi:hypothetical protein